ncbi:MAG: DUF5717 family protein [Clostridiales bacterium]|nr:DUF5717 family protein [Clostridiales bacterium]
MNTAALEAACAGKPAARAAVGLAVSHWLRGRIVNAQHLPLAAPTLGAPRSGSPDNIEWQKAFFVLTTAKKSCGVSPELLLMTIFMQIELGNVEIAVEMLSQLSESKNGLRANNSRIYRMYLFLQALLEIRRQKSRRARKFLKILSDYASLDKDPMTPLLKGILGIESGDYELGCQMLNLAFNLGCRSPFLYAYLYDCYSVRAQKNDPMLAPFLKWSLTHEADLFDIMDEIVDVMPQKFLQDAFWRDWLYRLHHGESFLKKIVQYFMGEGNYTQSALRYYKEAEQRLISIPELPQFLVSASYRSRSEALSRSVMEAAMARTEGMDMGLLAFCYHLTLTVKSLSQLADAKKTELLLFTMRCLENGMKGRYAITLYQHFLLNSGLAPDDKHRRMAEEIVWPLMFMSEVRCKAPEAKLIVSEWEKRELSKFDLRDGSAMIETCSSNFRLALMSVDEKTVLDEEAIATPMLKSPDPRIYRYFYDKGFRTFPLMAALAHGLLNQKNPPQADANIFLGILRAPELSKAFSSKIKAAAGHMSFMAGALDDACEHMKPLDESQVSKELLDEMLAVFIHAKAWEKAGLLLAKHRGSCSDKTIYAALKQLQKAEGYADMVAEPAYELLINNWYDKELMDIVLENFKASSRQWRSLSRVLEAVGADVSALNESILTYAVFSRNLTEGAEMIFASLWRKSPELKAVRDFSCLCAYEMLVNLYRPLHETLSILEKIYIEDKDPILACAISHSYLQHGLETPLRSRILADSCQFQKENDVLFPIFKEKRDNIPNYPYIDKNQPFMYRGPQGKEVWVHYKTSEEGAYRRKKMKYLRFCTYCAAAAVFYKETITYCIVVEMPNGSISTKEMQVENKVRASSDDSRDSFYAINSASMSQMMLRYDEAEEIVSKYANGKREIKFRLL